MNNKNKKTLIQPSTIHKLRNFQGGFEKSAEILKTYVTMRKIKEKAVDSLSRIVESREAGQFTLGNFLDGFL